MTKARQTEIEANHALRPLLEQQRSWTDLRMLAERCSGGRVLVDVGCGAGTFLGQVRDHYNVVVGIDFIPLQRSRHDNVHLVRADLRNGIPLPDSVATTLTAIELIEHIADPAGLIREAFRVARPGAELILTTPNVRYVRHLFRLVVQGRGPRTSSERHDDVLWDGGHIHYFTAKDIAVLLNDAGFVSVRARALIQAKGFLPVVRRLLSRWPNSPPVREFLTGRLMITGKKPEAEAA